MKKAFMIGMALLVLTHPAFSEVADKDLKIQSIQNDKFSQAITINGSVLSVNPFAGISRSWFIRSFYDKESHVAAHQLYVKISYLGDWNFFNFADDENARSLKVNNIGSRINDCTGMCDFDETVGVDLDESTLRAKAQAGYEIKLSAKSGESFVLKISSEQIRAQLLAIEQFAKPGEISIDEFYKKGPQLPSIPSKAMFGVNFLDLPPSAAVAMHHEGLKAALIVKVNPGSVADKAGVKMADTIFEFDGKPVDGALGLQKAVAAIEPGKKVSFKLLRGKDSEELTLNAQF
jgi:hypothetical protein